MLKVFSCQIRITKKETEALKVMQPARDRISNQPRWLDCMAQPFGETNFFSCTASQMLKKVGFMFFFFFFIILHLGNIYTLDMSTQL